jgi:hypothetical protein
MITKTAVLFPFGGRLFLRWVPFDFDFGVSVSGLSFLFFPRLKLSPTRKEALDDVVFYLQWFTARSVSQIPNNIPFAHGGQEVFIGQMGARLLRRLKRARSQHNPAGNCRFFHKYVCMKRVFCI